MQAPGATVSSARISEWTGPVERWTLPGATADRLYFAQVREDPRLEIEWLEPAAHHTLAVVSSAGCTALSLLARGAGRVVSVDLNRTQNHLVELKVAAVTAVDAGARGDAVAFLGGAPAPGAWRLATYRRLRGALSPQAQEYWDRRPRALEHGVLGAGVSERFIGVVGAAIRGVVHHPRRVRQLLACRSLEEQQAFFAHHWNNRRWRLLFRVLLNRWAFHRAYHPAWFQHAQDATFSSHFRTLAARTLTELPIGTNYFVHHMLTGRYPVLPGGVPPYLEPEGMNALVAGRGRLTLVDGAFIDHLRRCPPRSIHGFSLSNICEWASPIEIEALFSEIVRTAAPGSRLVFRNFVGWNEVPERWRNVVVEDRERGAAAIRRDRSAVQRRIALCRIEVGR